METRYHYVSLDSDHDLTAGSLQLSIDGATWAPADAVPEADLPPTTVGLPAPETGRTRYWWRILLGTGQVLQPLSGRTRLLGRFTDSPGPEILEPAWVIYT